MSKGERTREYILEKTSGLLNTNGYDATSVSEILEAVGLKKGGFYNHFSSKNELILEAFRYNARKLGAFLDARTAASPSWRTRLEALLEAAIDVAQGKPVPGGCPVLNAGCEFDDTDPELREAALFAAENLKSRILAQLEEGARLGELRGKIDLNALADFIFSSLEGGIFLSKLRNDSAPLEAVAEHVRRYLDGFV